MVRETLQTLDPTRDAARLTFDGRDPSALGAVRELRAAKGKRDGLALANAVVNILAVLTGSALVIRSLRKEDDE